MQWERFPRNQGEAPVPFSPTGRGKGHGPDLKDRGHVLYLKFSTVDQAATMSLRACFLAATASLIA